MQMDGVTLGRRRDRTVQRVVVYDPADGTIRHIHDVITVEGAEPVSDEEVERRALALAAEHGVRASDVKVLHTPDDDLQPGKRYRIDVASSSVVEIERPGGR
jgi:hypothetical protein